MAKKRNIVVKIGSALLANLELLTPRYGFLQRLLEDVAQLRAEGTNVILCSSGSVALGLRIIGETPESAGVSDKQAAAACGMPLLPAHCHEGGQPPTASGWWCPRSPPIRAQGTPQAPGMVPWLFRWA